MLLLHKLWCLGGYPFFEAILDATLNFSNCLTVIVPHSSDFEHIDPIHKYSVEKTISGKTRLPELWGVWLPDFMKYMAKQQNPYFCLSLISTNYVVLSRLCIAL